MKKIFDIKDVRDGKPVFCRSICFFPTRIEELSGCLSVDITCVEQNKITTKYDKAGRYYGDSNISGLDLITRVLDDNNDDITAQFLEERQINTVTVNKL